MKLQDFLLSENVSVGLSANSKDQLLRQLSQTAAQKTGIDAGVISRALLAREALGSTGIGEGVAIPHARIPELESNFCLFARLSKPIDFEAVDDRPVDIVVFVLSPTAAGAEPLNVLSCIARKFRDENVLRGIRTAKTADEVFALLVS